MATDGPPNPPWEGIYPKRTALTVVSRPGADEMQKMSLDNAPASGRLSPKVFKVVYITSSR